MVVRPRWSATECAHESSTWFDSNDLQTSPINLAAKLSFSREPRYRLPIGLLGHLDRFLLRPRFFMLRCALVVQIAVHLHEQLLHVVGQPVHGGVPVPGCVLRQCSEHTARVESATAVGKSEECRGAHRENRLPRLRDAHNHRLVVPQEHGTLSNLEVLAHQTLRDAVE